jgi:hypothetical protein
MRMRRVLIDGVVVVTAVGLLALPDLCQLRTKPVLWTSAPRSRLVAFPPVLGWQTNNGVTFGTVSLTLSNGGPTDLECEIEFFDCRFNR